MSWLLFTIDNYFHRLTHRATFIKDYLFYKISQVLNHNDDAKIKDIQFKVFGYYDFEKIDIQPKRRSTLSRFYVTLILGGALSLALFIFLNIIK